MVNFRNVSTKFLHINTLKRISATFGCLLFLISFISPFYSVSIFAMDGGGGSAHYWSYEFDIHVGRFVGRQYWFSDYWFSHYLDVGLRIPWIVVSMFTIQVLTLLFGVASIIFNRRMLSYAPVLLSVLTIALMVHTVMMEDNYWGRPQFGFYQLGFYLVFASLVLFLSAFVLNERTKKRQTKPTGDSSISTTGTTHQRISIC